MIKQIGKGSTSKVFRIERKKDVIALKKYDHKTFFLHELENLRELYRKHPDWLNKYFYKIFKAYYQSYNKKKVVNIIFPCHGISIKTSKVRKLPLI